jgi:cytochrome c
MTHRGSLRRMARAFLTLAPAVCVGVPGISRAQQKATKKAKIKFPPPGPQLYKRYRAVCHGNDGKGNGPPPSSSQLTAPPDLTTLP